MTVDAIVDDRFVAFGDVARRRLLYALSTASNDGHEMPFDGLVSRLASDDESGFETREQARLKLVHVHLPRLEQAQLVERADETVRLTVAPDVVTEALELARRFESN